MQHSRLHEGRLTATTRADDEEQGEWIVRGSEASHRFGYQFFAAGVLRVVSVGETLQTKVEIGEAVDIAAGCQ